MGPVDRALWSHCFSQVTVWLAALVAAVVGPDLNDPSSIEAGRVPSVAGAPAGQQLASGREFGPSSDHLAHVRDSNVCKN